MIPDFSTAPTGIPVQFVAATDADGVVDALPSPHRTWATTNGFSGKLGEICVLPDAGGAVQAVLFGTGAESKRQRGRFHAAKLASSLPEGDYQLPDEATDEDALGWLLAGYRFTRYKSKPDPKASLVRPAHLDSDRILTIAQSAGLTQDLINTPANDMGPAALEAQFRELAAAHEAEVNVITGDALLEQNFPLIHTVGRAAGDAPRLLDLRWGDPSAPKVTLVGKGVCFDTGGLNLKPGASMGLMKKDMGGAATVLGLAHMIMAADLPIRLRVLIPAVENGISAGAMRPGDVLTSRLGKTVEVNNTDAEGRLVLADALALAAEENPDLIVDMATLTGAARVALGPEVVPFYTANDELALTLSDASKQVADPLWRMPLWPGYERDIEPDIADLDNAPKGGFAGSITAALFLQRFVGDCEWVHFDIYGWTPSARPGRPTGGECQAARALFHMLDAQYGDAG